MALLSLYYGLTKPLLWGLFSLAFKGAVAWYLKDWFWSRGFFPLCELGLGVGLLGPGAWVGGAWAPGTWGWAAWALGLGPGIWGLGLGCGAWGLGRWGRLGAWGLGLGPGVWGGLGPGAWNLG